MDSAIQLPDSNLIQRVNNLYLYETGFPKTVAKNVISVDILGDRSIDTIRSVALKRKHSLKAEKGYLTLDEGIFHDTYFPDKLLVLLQHDFSENKDRVIVVGKYEGLVEVQWLDKNATNYFLLVDFLNEHKQKKFVEILTAKDKKDPYTGDYHIPQRRYFEDMLVEQVSMKNRIKDVTHRNI